MAVVGASGVLGGLVARGLQERGATVVAVGRDAGRLGEAVPGAAQVVGEIGDATLGDRLVAHCRDEHGRLDGVVNAAGVVAFGSLVDTDDAVIEELFLTDVIGPLFLARRVLPALAETKGYLANLSAVVAEAPLPGMVAYAAAKAALTAADRALAREARRTGVQVIDLRPPHTETGLATRPLAGATPSLPQGLAPERVAQVVLDAIERRTAEVASGDFA
ncbi:SDR family NAD(P)-dependent oxidoreductase [Arthrobacter sp. NEB 688]|nr:SDR family NAD(P)-dependent oxidoreductase [Arthrobacter sp. NEB 688]